VKRWLTWAGVGLLVAGCGREPAPEAAGAPLARPVIALAVKPGAAQTILIPRAALAERGGIPGVFVLSETSEARFRMVKPGAAQTILIPRAALAERGGIPGVFVLSETSEARFRMVKPGRGRDGEIEILSGLHGTETLVLGDLREVRDGSPVKILENADKRR